MHMLLCALCPAGAQPRVTTGMTVRERKNTGVGRARGLGRHRRHGQAGGDREGPSARAGAHLRAAQLGDTKAMVDLAAVAGTDAPEPSRYWYERAAILGNVQEMGEIPRFSD